MISSKDVEDAVICLYMSVSVSLCGVSDSDRGGDVDSD